MSSALQIQLNFDLFYSEIQSNPSLSASDQLKTMQPNTSPLTQNPVPLHSV